MLPTEPNSDPTNTVNTALLTPEETIAYGVAKEPRTFVRTEPREDARAVGLLRHGAAFEIVEQRIAEENKASQWHRLKNSVGAQAWIQGTEVQTRQDKPPKLGFAPRPPNLESGMPYPIGRVVADQINVYRRPPPKAPGEEDPSRFVLRTLQKGYFFTIDKSTNFRRGWKLWRGTRYWWIPRDGTTSVRAPRFSGIEVTDAVHFPFLWVTDPTAKLCTNPQNAAPQNTASQTSAESVTTCEPIARHTRLPFRAKHNAAGMWYETQHDHKTSFVSSLAVAYVDRVARPEGIYANERWVHVDLKNQYAVLYEGDAPQYVTLISSGDDEHATPMGTYRVESKHISATMDDENNLSSAYFIQDVPWVVYFKGGYALHGAFWHDRFGLKTSHGCVNLSPEDARRFFNFVDAPELPEGFHAVFTPPGKRSTAVHITR